MPRDEIIARLRLKGVTRFVLDAKFVERSLEGIQNAANADSLNNFGGALSQLQSVLPKGSTETGIFGLTLASLIVVVVAATPVVIALSGAVVALAGSLGAATLGAGALAVAAVGAAVPLGILGLVAMDAFQGFTKVNTAFSQWQKSVSMYGRNSTQAETALARLNAVAGQFGGPILIRAAQAWNHFMGAFRHANQGAIHTIYGIFLSLLSAGEKLLPTFSRVASIVSGALADGFRTVVNEITSSGFQQILLNLADTFARLSGPLIRSTMNFLMGLFSIANRLAPILTWIATGIERVSMAFRGWAESGALGGIISQFRSWWGLIKAVGGLLITLLSSGAAQGKGMVDSLTQIINKWNAWLNTRAGQNSLRQFFKDASDLTRTFISVLAEMLATWFKIGRDLIPTWNTVFKALTKGWHSFLNAMKPIAPFWNNVLGPILGGIAQGVLYAVVAGFKVVIFTLQLFTNVLGIVGRALGPFKGVFQVLTTVIGFAFAGTILRTLGRVGELSRALKPLGFLFKALGAPIRLAGWILNGTIGIISRVIGALRALTAAEVIASASGWASSFAAGIATMVAALASVAGPLGVFIAGLAALYHWRDKIINTGADIGVWLHNAVTGDHNVRAHSQKGDYQIKSGPGKGQWVHGGAAVTAFPGMATGGVVSGSGSWITGEAGPEINTLRNGRVTVIPLTPSVRAQGTTATVMPNDGAPRVLVSKIYLKGKQIAEAVADERDDERARK